jgi:hypothetical protein
MMHRVLFRQRRLRTLVSITHRCAMAGVVLLGFALTGVAVVIFDAVSGAAAGWTAGVCAAAALVLFWIFIPVVYRITDDNAPGQH